MDFREYLQILKNRWRTIVIFTVLGGLLALGGSLLMTPIYRASAVLYIASQESANVLEAYAAGFVSLNRVNSYVRLATTEVVAQRAIDTDKLQTTVPELQSKISTMVAKGTAIITLMVDDPDPETAQQYANSVASAYAKTVGDFEKTAGGAYPGAKLEVIEKAPLPEDPISPIIGSNVAIGLLFGLLVGLAVAVFRDLLDNRVKDRKTLEQATGVSVVGQLPFDSGFSKDSAIDFASSKSASAEAYRSLRTNLQFVAVDNPPRTIVVTSATPEEGKSTCAINLSLALAEAGHSVVIVEGDLRRPRIAKYLDVVSAVGLTTVIAGAATLADVLQPTKHRRLNAVASGPVPPNPSELLGSESFRSVLAQLRSVYDYVIIDAPPVLPVSDAAVMGSVTDGVLFVARHRVVKKEQVSHAVASLRAVGTHVLGTVLTIVKDAKGSKYGGDYYYYYAETSSPAGRQAEATSVTPRGPKAVLPDPSAPRH